MMSRIALPLCLAACGGSTQASVVAPQGAAPAATPTSTAAPQGTDAPSSDVAPTPGRPKTLAGTSIHFGGGDGSSMEKAIVILGAQGEQDGVAAEYGYIEQLYGPRGAAWQMNEQALLEKNGHHFDELEIDHGGKTESFFFDISDYFGKM